jgi:hypothetical protein
VAPRPAYRLRRALALAGGVALSAGILLFTGGPGGYGRPSSYYVTLAAAWLAIGVSAAWLGVARGRSMLGRPASQRLLVAVLTPIALAVSALIAGVVVHPLLRPTGLLEHTRCISFTVLMAFGPLVAFTFARRGSDPVAPRFTGAAIGAAAGALGALGIELRCSHAGMFHVLLAHVLPVVALAFVGAFLAGRFIDVQAGQAGQARQRPPRS